MTTTATVLEAFSFVGPLRIPSSSPPTDLASFAAMLARPLLSDPDLGLGRAIALYESKVCCPNGFSFFRDLLPRILILARNEEWCSRPIPLLFRGVTQSIFLPREQVRCLMAHAFLLNIVSVNRVNLPGGRGEEGLTFGSHSWERLFSQPRCEISVQKIVCLLAMLHRACLEAGEEAIRSSDKNDDEKQGALLSREVAGVTVERIHLSSYEGKMSPPSISSTAPLWLDTTSVSILTGPMEDSPASTFVDFANRFVGYKSIIPSATQEEILWCMAPELWLASFCCESLAEDEVVVVRGVRRASTCSGYAHSFKWAGFYSSSAASVGSPSSSELHPQTSSSANFIPLPLDASPMTDILVIDAMVVSQGFESQFSADAMRRDMTKAWLAFNAIHKPDGKISSGNWGCGAFGGCRYYKFLQQLCAISEVNASRRGEALHLDFSVYRDEVFASRLEEMLRAIATCPQDGGVTVGGMCRLFDEYHRGYSARPASRGRDGDEHFYQWIMGRLKQGVGSNSQGSVCSLM